jgi:hypothetical protein
MGLVSIPGRRCTRAGRGEAKAARLVIGSGVGGWRKVATSWPRAPHPHGREGERCGQGHGEGTDRRKLPGAAPPRPPRRRAAPARRPRAASSTERRAPSYRCTRAPSNKLPRWRGSWGAASPRRQVVGAAGRTVAGARERVELGWM